MLKTEQQKKDLCGGCPIAKVADLVGDSWVLLIIRDLLKGPKRFTELLESLSGISSRTLTKKLEYLEEQQMLTRKAFSEKPPRVEYSLTEKGKQLKSIILQMQKYGEEYM